MKLVYSSILFVVAIAGVAMTAGCGSNDPDPKIPLAKPGDPKPMGVTPAGGGGGAPQSGAAQQPSAQ